jgi:hypothetical protein
MTLKHKDLSIPKETPFANCKLDREKYADILTTLVGSYADGFVLAVDNEWGTGKTTFIKMWQQKLNNNAFKTVYFNAWENDFENNALVALIAEMQDLTTTKTKEIYEQVLKKGAVLSKQIVPILLKAIAAKYFDKDTLKELFGGLVDGVTGIFENQVKDYVNKQKGLSKFKAELTKFVQKTSEEKPIIIFVDELDRCRPDYAVEVLEKIKHFFSVPNIVFVLSIDKHQLCNSIRGFYGSDKINAEEYLRRFIDIEYAIPAPDTNKFVNYLFEYFEFDKFFNSEERRISEFSYDKEHFLKLSKKLFKKRHLSLRQQEKIYAQARMALKTFPIDHYVFPEIFLTLVVLKICEPNFYKMIKNKEMNSRDLISKLSRKIDLDNWMEPLFAFLYYNYFFVRNNRIDNFIATYQPVTAKKITRREFSDQSIWETLINEGYIDNQGNVLDKISSVSKDNLPSFLSSKYKDHTIFEYLKNIFEEQIKKLRGYMEHLNFRHSYLELSHLFKKIDLLENFIE